MARVLKEYYFELYRNPKTDTLDFEAVEGPQPQYSDKMITAVGPIRAETWEEAVTILLGRAANFSFTTDTFN